MAIVDSRVREIDALNAISLMHSHANKSTLDGITNDRVQEWNSKQDELTADQMSLINSGITREQLLETVNYRHTHANKTTLDGLTNTKITQWDGKQDALTSQQLSVLYSGITAETFNKFMAVYNWYETIILPTISDDKLYLLKNGTLIEVTGGMVWMGNN